MKVEKKKVLRDIPQYAIFLIIYVSYSFKTKGIILYEQVIKTPLIIMILTFIIFRSFDTGKHIKKYITKDLNTS